MKKLVLSVMIFLLIIICALSVMAKTIVEGKITWGDKTTPVGGADVNVTCYHGDAQASNHTISEDDGTYAVEFLNAKCDDGDTAEVTAKKGSASGSNSGIVHDFGLTVNLAIVNVSIPEFTAITAGIAVFGAAAGYIALRKKRSKG